MNSLHRNKDKHVNIQHRNPLDRLPVELYLEIFSHHLKDSKAILRRNHLPSLINLALVNRRWHEICISGAKLWSSFEIDFSPGNGHNPNVEGNIEVLVSRWLALSKTHSLSIRLQYTPPKETLQRTLDPCPALVIKLLIPHMARCHELGLSVPSACATPFLEMQPARNNFTPFRSLRRLKLDMQGVWYAKQSLDVLSMGIDWAQMTDLHLMLDSGHMLTLDECLCLLGQARSLQSCSLNAICLLSSEEQGEVSLDACRDLRLVFQGEVGLEAERSAVAFLSRINAPFLKTFQVEWFVSSPFPWDMEAEQALWAPQHARFLSFLERTGKSLETLRISHLPLAEAQLIQCIAVAKRVENLELKFSLGRDSNDPLSDRFFRRLGDRDVLLPKLRNLKLQCHGKAVTSANLDNLIRKRKLHNVSAFIGTKLSIHPSTSAKWKARQTSVSLSFFTDF